MRKNFKGFTLMELIVVLAIVAVLTGVLIPSATYFIRQAKLKTANAQAKVVFNAALTVSQEYEAKNITVMNVTTGDPDGYTSSVGNVEDFSNVETYTGNVAKAIQERVNAKVMEVPEADEDVWAVRYEDKGTAFPVLTGACYSTTNADRYVGCYPVNNTPTDFQDYGALNESTMNSWLIYASGATPVTP